MAEDTTVDTAATDTSTADTTQAATTTTTADTTQATVASTADTSAATGAADTAVKTDWPEDWRNKAAGGDEKLQKRLERYASPKAVVDALVAAQAKISSGELKSALKPDATPEEVKTWREENGIPDSPDKYEISLGNGRVIGEADKPIVDEFLKSAHEVNMHPSQVSKALEWYYNRMESAESERAATDAALREEAVQTLRDEFGADYRKNVTLAKEVLPADLRDVFLAGRMADGTMIGDNPAVIRWLANMARELNPIGTVVPGSGTNGMQALENELATLKTMMADRSPTSEYWKGPKAAQHQARYRELLEAKSKVR